jgi:hypothetical protein
MLKIRLDKNFPRDGIFKLVVAGANPSLFFNLLKWRTAYVSVIYSSSRQGLASFLDRGLVVCDSLSLKHNGVILLVNGAQLSSQCILVSSRASSAFTKRKQRPWSDRNGRDVTDPGQDVEIAHIYLESFFTKNCFAFGCLYSENSKTM